MFLQALQKRALRSWGFVPKSRYCSENLKCCTENSKFSPGRVLCTEFFKQVGADSSRSLDSQNYFRRFTPSVCKYASKDRGKDYPCTKPISYVKYIRRGTKVIRKRCYRKGTTRPGRSGVLQHLFHSAQEGRWNPSNSQFKTSECSFKERPLQDGNFTFNHSSTASRGLGSLNRFKRCVSSPPNICSSPQIPEVLCKGSAFSVSCHALRSGCSATSVYKGYGSSGGHLRSQQVHIFMYLDDWLIKNRSVLQLQQQLLQTVNLLVDLGLLINIEKSQLVPSQVVTYLGAVFNLREGLVFPTEERFLAVQQAIMEIESKSHAPACSFLRMLGLMASCIDIVPMARLHMRPIQLYLLYFWRPCSQLLSFLVPVLTVLIEHLEWWKCRDNFFKGMPPHSEPLQVSIYS